MSTTQKSTKCIILDIPFTNKNVARDELKAFWYPDMKVWMVEYDIYELNKSAYDLAQAAPPEDNVQAPVRLETVVT